MQLFIVTDGFALKIAEIQDIVKERTRPSNQGPIGGLTVNNRIERNKVCLGWLHFPEFFWVLGKFVDQTLFLYLIREMITILPRQVMDSCQENK
jgi:hypothetical protein